MNSDRVTFQVIDIDTELADTIPVFEKWASAALDRNVRVLRDGIRKDFQSLAAYAGLTTDEWTEVRECLRNLPRLWIDLPRRTDSSDERKPKLPEGRLLFRAHRFNLNSQKHGTAEEQTRQWIQEMFPQDSLVLQIVEL